MRFGRPARGYDSHVSTPRGWEYPGDLAAASAARGDLRSALEGSPDSLIDDVVLVATELVTNAVRHGSGPVLLTLEKKGDDLIIAVTGAASGDPHMRSAPTEAPSGRGLAIAAALADEWGWHREGEQVTVWARLRSPADPTP